ncbi:hypothetical protein E8E14_003267 [Neopestalotiopsis sp. 37M]|nr:hypothetical protein E8E14_003267 [Neopestalotiopsis sp. 37M]
MVLQQVTTPPGQVTPYVISAYDGETLQLPGTKSVIRILASAKETNGTFSVFRMDGVAGEPVGFHYHNEAHDIFMCARGQLEVWAGDKARLLNAGDFAYVPPGIIHRPKLAGNWTETIGLITPGDWVDFFRFLSEPFDGILADEQVPPFHPRKYHAHASLFPSW